jgi:hypothetical protein
MFQIIIFRMVERWPGYSVFNYHNFREEVRISNFTSS